MTVITQASFTLSALFKPHHQHLMFHFNKTHDINFRQNRHGVVSETRPNSIRFTYPQGCWRFFFLMLWVVKHGPLANHSPAWWLLALSPPLRRVTPSPVLRPSLGCTTLKEGFQSTKNLDLLKSPEKNQKSTNPRGFKAPKTESIWINGISVQRSSFVPQRQWLATSDNNSVLTAQQEKQGAWGTSDEDLELFHAKWMYSFHISDLFHQDWDGFIATDQRLKPQLWLWTLWTPNFKQFGKQLLEKKKVFLTFFPVPPVFVLVYCQFNCCTFIRKHQVQEVQQDQRSDKISRHEAELVQMQLAPEKNTWRVYEVAITWRKDQNRWGFNDGLVRMSAVPTVPSSIR